MVAEERVPKSGELEDTGGCTKPANKYEIRYTQVQGQLGEWSSPLGHPSTPSRKRKENRATPRHITQNAGYTVKNQETWGKKTKAGEGDPQSKEAVSKKQPQDDPWANEVITRTQKISLTIKEKN